MATKLLHVEMEISWWFSLASAIWIIYTSDHLIDAFKLPNPQGDRRKFYARNFSKLLTASVIILIINIFTTLLFLDPKIILFGIILGTLTALYLLTVFAFGKKMKYWLQKELSVAIIYTIGIWGSIIIESNHFPSTEIYLVISLFFLLVLADIMIFALLEFEQDQQNQFISLIGMVGQKISKLLIYASLIITLFFSTLMLVNFNYEYKPIAIIFLSMSIILFFLIWFEKKILKNDWFRYLGEAIFYIPALYLLF